MDSRTKKTNNKRFVRYSEGAEMYSMSVSKFMQLPFLLYTVRQVALFVFRISFLHSDRLPGHRLHIFHRVPAFPPVSLRFSDVSGHNPVPVLSSVFYLDNPLS